MSSGRKLKLGTFHPKHSSNSTKAWLHKKPWKIPQWPSVNPIENLWWDLKKAVAARKPNNITELEASAHEEWAKIPQNRCQKLLSGYTSHLQQVMTGNDVLPSTKDACREGVD